MEFGKYQGSGREGNKVSKPIRVSLITAFFLSFVLASSSFAESITYVYDDLNRLTHVVYDDGADLKYGYDEIGNRTLKYLLQFSCDKLPVKMASAYYTALLTPLSTAADGTTVQAMFFSFAESLDFNREVSLTLDGGYGCDYATVLDYATINGTVTITSGSVTLSNIVVR